MRDGTWNRADRKSEPEEELGKVGLPLEELVRRGAREILQRAPEVEVEAFLERIESVPLLDGRRAVVPSGHLPEREILTAVGQVPVEVPKVRPAGSVLALYHVTMRELTPPAPQSQVKT